MKTISFITKNAISEISQQLWDSFVSNDRVSIQYNHLKAIESSRINNHIPFYTTIYNEKSECIGIAYYVVIAMDMSSTSDDIDQNVVKTVQQWYPNFMNMKMLECGLLTGLGQTFHILPDYEIDVLPQLIENIEINAKKHNVDFIVYRDIKGDTFNRINKSFADKRYEAINGYSFACMTNQWTSFDDYENDLCAEKRKKVNRSLRKLEFPGIKVEVLYDISEYADDMDSLWHFVADESHSYSHEELNAEFFRQLQMQFGNNIQVIGIKYNNQLIAFVLNYYAEDEYFLCFAGYNKRLNKEFDLYLNLYFISMKYAMENNFKILNMGITTYNIKAQLGCDMVDVAYFMKNLKDEKISHSLANFFVELIDNSYDTHKVFSSKVEIQHVENVKIELSKPMELDIFQKAQDYHRINLLRLMGVYSFFPAFESAQRAQVQYKGEQLFMLGSNSYLGLSNDERLQKAAKDAIDFYGTGCSGSPSMNGTLDIHKKLAEQLALFTKKEDCIIYSTGYQANLGAIGALATSSDMIILDEYSHASLIDGAIFSKAKIARYRHNDLDYLDNLLNRFSDKRKLVIADSVFSMEGTVVNLPKLVEVCKKHNTRLVLDEAHAIGVYGENGGGVAEYFNMSDQVDIITGTFSKSCASVGGFVAGDQKVIDFLRHTSRSHVFSATLPPASVATVLKALEIIKQEPERRKKLVENARYMANGLRSMGYEIQYHDTAIVPIFCRDEVITLSLFKKLIDKGVYVNPVLYPAVPKGGELLRTSYLATHTKDQLDDILAIFDSLRTKYFPVVPQSVFASNIA